MISVKWWCPTCNEGILNKDPCPRCDHERVKSWKCDNCNGIVVKSRACNSCGRKEATAIYNRVLVQRLFENTGRTGHTNMEIIRKYAYLRAAERGVPQYLVEDVISMTLMRLVMHIPKFDREKGKFRTWAIKILDNEMSRLAKRDATESGRVQFSLDQESADDELAMESVIGSTYGVEDLIAMEEKQRFVLMAKLAERAFGRYSTVVEGEAVTLSLYRLCVETYITRDGIGWAAKAARIAGISRQAISAKQMWAREKWQECNRKNGE